jgi:hypothetical protein
VKLRVLLTLVLLCAALVLSTTFFEDGSFINWPTGLSGCIPTALCSK